MGLSIQIDRLNVGSKQLDGQKFSPILKKRAETYLSNYLLSRQITLGGQKTPFTLNFGSMKPTLQLGERRVSIENGEPFHRLYRYCQHIGHLPRQAISAQEKALIEQTTKRAIQDVNKAAIPGTNGRILAGMRVTDDSLSVTRNFLYALPSVRRNDPIVNHLGYYASMFWGFFAIRELDSGVTELKRSQKIGDAEGTRRAGERILSGTVCTMATASSLLGRVSDSFASLPIGWGLLDAANVLFGVGSLISMGSASLGALRCYRFNERINVYLENENLSQVEKLRGALQYLKDAVSVTPEEKRQMQLEIERNHPDWSSEKKQKFLEQKMTDSTEAKVKYIKRRTSNKSLQLILNDTDKLLDKLARPETRTEGVKEAAVMLHTIQKENRTKMALYILGFVAALISFVAMLTMTFFTAGALPFVLYGISGTIYLAMSIYYLAGMVMKKEPGPVDLHPLQDMGPLISG